MAKLLQGICGPVSGKIGPIVGASWKNIAYVRAAPKKRKKNQPRSSAQIASQQKFKFVTELMVPFHPYVTVGFKHLATSRTELNAAFSLNYKEAIVGAYPNLGVDYSKIMVSKGNLPQLLNVTAGLITANTIELNWQLYKERFASFDDQLMLVLYSPELKLADGFIGGTKRAQKKCRFTFNPRLAGKQLEVYLGLTSLDRKKVANSQYLGRIDPL